MALCSDSHAPLTQIFVLRLWRERPDAPWRAALRAADGAAPIGFADLEQLAAFLLRLTHDAPDEGGTITTTER